MSTEKKPLKEVTSNLLYSEVERTRANEEKRKQELLKKHDDLAADVFNALNAMRATAKK